MSDRDKKIRILISAFLSMVLISTAPNLLVAADFELGADAYGAGDYKTALSEWQPLTDEGDPLTQHNLALLYEAGLGVPQDRNKAAQLYALAVGQGLAASQFVIGNLNLSEFYGSRDQVGAIAWY